MVSKSSIINIDKIFEEGREPTEEEWKIWAESFKPKRITERKPEHEARLKKKKAKVALYDRQRKQKEYKERKKTGHKSWGKKYNEKRKYLYKYNPEWRENLRQSQQLRAYKLSSTRYNSWVNKYRKYYKNKLDQHASTFKIEDNVYVYGFTLTQMRQMGPLSAPYFKKFMDSHVFPEPVYEGYRFKNNKISNKKERFYLLTEAIAYFSIFDKHKSKIGNYTEEKLAFLKKKFWGSMLQAREEFNNE